MGREKEIAEKERREGERRGERGENRGERRQENGERERGGPDHCFGARQNGRRSTEKTPGAPRS